MTRANCGRAALKLWGALALLGGWMAGYAAPGAQAMPASSDPVTVKQPDGTKIEVFIRGDEWNHWLETPSGAIVTQDAATKSYVYAQPARGGGVEPTKAVVGKVPPPRGEFSPAPPQNLAVLQAQAARPVVVPSGAARVLTILITFSDTNNTVAASSFDSMLFGSGGGSMRSFYTEMSRGQFTVEAGPAGLIGWYRAPKTRAYYGDTYPHAAELVRDAVQIADSSGVDFRPYDQNNDGRVDVVNIVHQGPGEETSGVAADIWSHRWDLGSSGVGNFATDDGVTVSDYIMNPEMAGGAQNTIGVFAHEYGHALGLPDLYDTDGSSQGIGEWSLMASGGYNRVGGASGTSPAHMDAWCKTQMGWVTPIEVTANRINESIAATQESGVVYKMRTNEFGSQEYYLVENRQKVGFDGGLRGAGLLIYHIDDVKGGGNRDNTQEWYPGRTSTGHYRVALEQADGLFNMDRNQGRGDGGDPWPGSTNNRAFTQNSTPDSKPYSGANTALAVKNISASSSTMRADLIVSSVSAGQTVSLVSPAQGAQISNAGTVTVAATASKISAFRRMDFFYRLAGGSGESAPALAIRDNSTLTDTINITAPGNIALATLSVDITHTWISDLVVTLIAPDGTRVVVHNSEGGSDDDIIKSYDVSSALAGKAQAGAWKLEVKDTASGDTGTLNRWNLSFSGDYVSIGSSNDSIDGEWRADWNVSGLAAGDYDVKVVATDTDGISDLTDEHAVTLVANMAPTVEPLLTPAAPGPYDFLRVNPQGADADGDTLSYTFTYALNGTPVTGDGHKLDLSQFSVAVGDTLSVTVVANDGQADSAPGVISVVIATPPTANALSGSALSGVRTAIEPITGSDPNGLGLVYRLVEQGAHGTAFLSQSKVDGITRLYYTSVPGYSGPDTVKFIARNAEGRISFPATVSITVTSDSIPSTSNVVASTMAGMRVSMALSGNDTSGEPVRFRIVQQPANGSAFLSKSSVDGVTRLYYTSTPDYSGQAVAKFVAINANGTTSAVATATIDVASNAAPSAFDVSTTAISGVRINMTLNGTDPDGGVLRFRIVGQPTNGSAFLSKSREDGQTRMFYTSNANFVGKNTAQYVVIDQFGRQSAPATATITVTGVSGAPPSGKIS